MCKICDNEEQGAGGKDSNGMVYNSCEEKFIKEQSCCGIDMEEMGEELGMTGMDYGKKGTSKPHKVTMDDPMRFLDAGDSSGKMNMDLDIKNEDMKDNEMSWTSKDTDGVQNTAWK